MRPCIFLNFRTFGRAAIYVIATLFFMHFSILSTFARPFPEEASREDWDRGCADWPIIVPNIGQGQAERNPGIFIEKANGDFRVYAKMKLTPEKGEDFGLFFERFRKLALDGGPYPQWVLPGINEKPGGGRYFVSVDGLTVGEVERGTHFYLTGPYTFQILWFKRAGTTTIELRHEFVNTPVCDVFATYKKQGSKKDFSINLLKSNFADTGQNTKIERVMYRMTPRPDLIRLLVAEMYLIPNFESKELELRLRMVARPSPFVYQIMPESLMRDEVHVRAKRIFDNLVELRRSLAFSAAATSASSAPLKSEVNSKKARSH